MNNKLYFMGVLSLLLSACGSGDKADRKMELTEQYTVAEGDQVVRSTETTKIKISHTDGSKTSTVQLVEGNATIIYKK